MLVWVSQQQMVKPVPPKRAVCKRGGGRGKVYVLTWGGLFQRVILQPGVERCPALRVVTDGAEVSRGHSTYRNFVGVREGLNAAN